jgi:subtilisin family serine protease
MDFVEPGDGHSDHDGHGTAMAGLIAARGRPGGAGALGISPKAKILPVRVGAGQVHLSEGILWAVDHGARVVCVAAGSNDPNIKNVIDKALAADVLVVAAAGNRPDDKRVLPPARLPGVLAAGGVDRDGNHVAVSVTGPEIVLTAPAERVWSTDTGGGYVSGTGTSDATAILAGAAALVRAKYPNLSAPEVIHRLTATAIDKGPPGRDDEYGYGIVDLVAALTKDVPPLGSPSASPQAKHDGRGPPTGWIVAGLLAAGALVAAGIAFSLRRARRRAKGVTVREAPQ